MMAVSELSRSVPTTRACEVLSVPRSSVYRERRGPRPKAEPRTTPARALSQVERATVRSLLNSEQYVDQPPRAVYADLLENGEYHCSWRTMYRVLDEYDEVRERRNQLRHPRHEKPVLVARRPNAVWTWDITKLKGAVKGEFYFLYVILDIFSRYAVGWMIAQREREELARHLIAETCAKHDVQPGELTLHADRGSPMIAKNVAELFIELGVAKSHSRPRVSNDNAYSEAQFKTLKYRPTMPERFGFIQDSREHCRTFFAWYNDEHYHTSLGLMTPATVHFGRVNDVVEQRQRILNEAYASHPERFVHGPPTALRPPAEAWINQPAIDLATSSHRASLTLDQEAPIAQ